MALRPWRWLLLVLLAGLVTVSCGGDDGTPSAKTGAATLPTRTSDVESVEVRVTPTKVSEHAAVFAIALDTHSGDLGVDLEKAATLTVGGTDWPVTGFVGDGPGGHHRQGRLRFGAKGAPSGEMRLRIVGLGEPVTFTWKLEP